eukprot:10526995-Heterocapsa_arctica.AAC.1
MPVIRTPLAPPLRALTQLPALTVWLFMQHFVRDVFHSTASGLYLLWICPAPLYRLLWLTSVVSSLLGLPFITPMP